MVGSFGQVGICFQGGTQKIYNADSGFTMVNFLACILPSTDASKVSSPIYFRVRAVKVKYHIFHIEA